MHMNAEKKNYPKKKKDRENIHTMDPIEEEKKGDRKRGRKIGSKRWGKLKKRWDMTETHANLR